jgi:uncharacterized paraquat-inducible protein A
MKKRFFYIISFLLIFCIEVLIALYVRDNFIRPYVGDMLVVVLVYSFVRIFLPTGIPRMPFYVFLSACVMLIGYTIIAVPTGIVSASMMKDYKRRRDKECPNCHRSGHEDNAEFCKYCGHHLNPSETDVEKK